MQEKRTAFGYRNLVLQDGNSMVATQSLVEAYSLLYLRSGATAAL